MSSRVNEKNVGGFWLFFKSGIDKIYVSFDIKLESKLAKKELRVTGLDIGNEKDSINIYFDLIVKGADLGGRNIISVALDAVCKPTGYSEEYQNTIK